MSVTPFYDRNYLYALSNFNFLARKPLYLTPEKLRLIFYSIFSNVKENPLPFFLHPD